MLYNRHNLSCARFASKNDNKPELASVFFTSNKTVATDSMSLLEVSVPADVKPEDYPQVQGNSAMRGCKPFMINAKALTDIKIPKSKNLPILENVAIKYIDDKRVEFMTTDLEAAKITTAKRVEGMFPDYESIVPRGNSVVEFTINSARMVEMLRAIAELDARGYVKVLYHGKDKPLELRAGNEVQHARGLIMPIQE